jgi:RNA polymerase sigma-70 factor (ECF subfamily)
VVPQEPGTFAAAVRLPFVPSIAAHLQLCATPVDATATASRAAPEIDELTLARAVGGDTTAFRRLVEHHQRAVFALLSRMLRDPPTVEDLAQETFVRVFRGLPDLGARDRRHNVGAWILTIAARLAIDEVRRRPLRPVQELSGAPSARLVSPDPGPDREVLRLRLGRAIERAVDELAPEYRAAFLLREIHGLEYEAIAAALAIDIGTVKSRLSRARAALRQALAEYAEHHDEI